MTKKPDWVEMVSSRSWNEYREDEKRLAGLQNTELFKCWERHKKAPSQPMGHLLYNNNNERIFYMQNRFVGAQYLTYIGDELVFFHRMMLDSREIAIICPVVPQYLDAIVRSNGLSLDLTGVALHYSGAAHRSGGYRVRLFQ